MADDVVHHQGRATDGSMEQLMVGHGHMGRGTAAATVFDGDVRQDHAHLAHRQPGFAADTVLLAPLFFLRCQGLGHEAPHAVGELLEFFGHPGGAVVVQHGD
ncbi:hypothetical protein D9M69_581810 [compost metagenome]